MDSNTQQNSGAGKNIPELLGMLARAVTLATSIGFVITVTYDWSLLNAVGLDFLSVPTVLSDHFRGAVLWFPLVTLTFMLWAIIETSLRRLERGFTEEEIVESQDNPDRARRLRDLPWKIIEWVCVANVVIFFAVGDLAIVMLDGYLLAVSFCIAWFKFSTWLNNAALIQKRRPHWAKMTLVFLPAVFLFFLVLGYAEGRTFLYTKKPDHRLLVNLGSGPVEIECLLVRNYENCLVLLDPDSGQNLVLDRRNCAAIQKLDSVPDGFGIFRISDSWARKRTMANGKTISKNEEAAETRGGE